MIKFFRQFRQNLINEGKTSKYLKYAIGEIVLVVIGILIALQINNWNENRKEKLQLKTALHSIYIDLVSDSLLIHNELPTVIVRHGKNKAILKKSYATSTNLDTLINIMKNEFPMRWYASPAYNKNTFTNLKSTGAFDILPLNIKEALSEYYTVMEFNQSIIEKTLDQYRNHLDDFVKRYNIIGRFYDDNYNNSYLYNSTWKNINEKDFTPRVAVLIVAYDVLYRNAKFELETNQKNLRKILPQLQPYLEQ